MAKKKDDGSVDLYQFQRLLQGKGIYSLIYKDLYKTSNKFSKEKIMKAINSKDVKTLRKMSRYFYYKSGIYKRLIIYLSTMYLMYYKVTPKNHKKFGDKKFEMYHDKVFEYINELGMETFSEINQVVFTEGIFFGYQRDDANEYTVQQLPTEYCRTIAKYPSGNYMVEFDLRFFNTFKYAEDNQIKIINLYPKELVKAWVDYISGKTDYHWYQISEEHGMCFPVDDIGMPPLAGIFTELIELDNYKKFEKIKTALDLIKIVVQKIPLDDDKQPAYELEEAQAVHQNLIAMLRNNDNIDGYTTPFDVDVLNLKDKSEGVDANNVMKAERTLFNEAGVSSNLGNAEGNIALTNSIKSDQAWVRTVISLYQRWMHTHINKYVSDSKNYNFDFEILSITWYNQTEWQDKYYQGATSGISKLEYAISLGIKQDDLVDKLIYENNYLDLDSYITPLMTAHTASGDGGRPTSSDTELTPSGVTTRENGSNEARK